MKKFLLLFSISLCLANIGLIGQTVIGQRVGPGNGPCNNSCPTGLCVNGSPSQLTFDINLSNGEEIDYSFDQAGGCGASTDYQFESGESVTITVDGSSTTLFTGGSGTEATGSDCIENNSGATITITFTVNSNRRDESILVDYIIRPATGACNALPVEITSLTANSAGTTVAISWSTSSEDGNDYFAVEQSRDGKEFKEIGQIAGAGWSIQGQEYNFIQENVQPGTQYYRLRQVDFDGKYEFSPVVSVEVKSNGSAFLVYPTIARSEVHIDIPDNSGSDATLQIFDANGQVVYSEPVGGKGTVTINVNEFTPGAYFIRFWNGNQFGNGRFFRF